MNLSTHSVLRALLWLGAFVAMSRATSSARTVVLGRFVGAEGSPPPPPWRLVRLSDKVPPTQYRLRLWDGVHAVEAQAKGSMALLGRPLAVDLTRTPVLCWRWRVEATLTKAELTRKSGDDYAARVYVGFRLPSEKIGMGLKAKLALARLLYGATTPDAAVNYVWDNRHPIGFEAPNAYTKQTWMIVAQSGSTRVGTWVPERHDVLADARRAFGTDRITPTLLAIASDTDNTGETAVAGFADIHFVAPNQECQFPPLDSHSLAPPVAAFARREVNRDAEL